MNRRRYNITSFENGVDQINSNTYHDYIFMIGCFQHPNLQHRSVHMIWTCDDLFKHQHKKSAYLIRLCKGSIQKYHFYVLKMINMFYHIYIESE